jgi:GR25 family glycosyltransferase involved in LPS biosynthesis
MNLSSYLERTLMDQLLTSFLKKPWKAYCISLPRCTERRERFQAWAQENKLSVTFWDAYDKREMSEDVFEEKKVFVADHSNRGATACRISHEELWKECLQQKEEYFFILEDDAGFLTKSLEDVKGFVEGVFKSRKSWSILQLGFGTMTGSHLHLLSSRIPKGIYHVDFCDQTHAILYTRQAIQEMYALSQDPKYKTRPSDGLLLAYVQKKKGIVLAPETSVIEQTDSTSYIGTS